MTPYLAASTAAAPTGRLCEKQIGDVDHFRHCRGGARRARVSMKRVVYAGGAD
jgi:hypothetical protein